MSRIYTSLFMFGITRTVNEPDPVARATVVYQGKHPFLQAAIGAGLDWSCRDMTDYGSHEDGDVLLYVGRTLSQVDVDVPYGGIPEDELAVRVADARTRLREAGYADAPAFHHVADHSD